MADLPWFPRFKRQRSPSACWDVILGEYDSEASFVSALSQRFLFTDYALEVILDTVEGEGFNMPN